MTNLMAVLAGGLNEAKRYLKTEIKASQSQARIFGFWGALFLTAAGAIGYYSYIKYRQLKQLKDSIEKSKMEIHRMPTVRAEEMGTYCLICMCQPSNIVLIPCNHLCICSECFIKYKENNNGGTVQCPMCRLDVDLKH